MTEFIRFESQKNKPNIIKVLGVGGGGSNAVNHMFKQGIKGVDFWVSNTDSQSLEASPVPSRLKLGKSELGAGSIPSVGKEAAEDSIELIKESLSENTKMLFVTAGMGGGTGTGAAPVIAKIARELNILTVGIVTIPFSFEGRKRRQQAEAGIEELRKYVDSLLVISNDKLREIHGDLKLSEAFAKADNILSTAARGIAEIITVSGYVNVDFEDVKTVMLNSGKAILGSATASGEGRAMNAVQAALASPLLDDNDINGASHLLLYIASGEEETSLDEITEITEYVQSAAGMNADMIWGTGSDSSLGDNISVTLIATGFDSKKNNILLKQDDKIVHHLSSVTIPDADLSVLAKQEIVENTADFNITEVTLIKKPEFNQQVENELTVVPLVNESEIRYQVVNEQNTEISPEKEPLKITVNEPEQPHEPQFIYPEKPVTFNNPVETSQQEIEEAKADKRNRLKGLNTFGRNEEEIENMEKIPAYLRRNVVLNEMKASSESQASRYILTDQNQNPEITKTDNSFFHKKPD